MLTLDRAKNKSFQVEASYHRDGSDLNRARVRLDSAGRKVTELKAHFWSEMRRVSREMRTPTGDNATALLNPLKQLKKELSAAELERYDAKSQVESAVSKVVQSGKQRDSFSGLVATLKAKASRKREGHRQEEITEGAVFRLGLRGKGSSNGAAAGSQHAGEARKPTTASLSTPLTTQYSHSSRSEKRFGVDLTDKTAIRVPTRSTAQVPDPIQGYLQSPALQPPAATCAPQQVASAVGARHSVTEVVHTVEAGEHTLSLSFQLSDGRSVGLQITAGRESTARISIDPRGEALNSLLLRERGALLSRLQAAGIKVQEIAIGPSIGGVPQTSGMQATEGRNARRRRLDDDNELEP